jgi:hypothetical protein
VLMRVSLWCGLGMLEPVNSDFAVAMCGWSTAQHKFSLGGVG